MTPEVVSHIAEAVVFTTGAVYFIAKARAERKKPPFDEEEHEVRYTLLLRRVESLEDQYDDVKHRLDRHLRNHHVEATDVG